MQNVTMKNLYKKKPNRHIKSSLCVIMNTMNFNPSQEEINFVNTALARFNDEKVGPDNHELLNIVEYDEKHNVIAGILGGTY